MARQASRNDRIAPFHVMALLGRAQELQAAGHDVIHLEVGEPDFPTPAPIIAAGQQALAAGLTRYTPASGLPALRETIANYYQERFAVSVQSSQILVTPGGSGALQLALALLVDPGDGVLLSDPGYPCNRHFVELVNGIPQTLPLGTDVRVTAAKIAEHWQGNTVATLLASPDNPSGAVLSGTDCADIASAVARLGGTLIVDEIYQGLVYDQPVHSVLSETSDALVLNSFSKYFGMTGWRLGWMVAPQAHVAALERMAQNFFIAAPTMSQHAALAAFLPETRIELDRRRDLLNGRRQLLLTELPGLGFRVAGTPQGAFYIYVDVSAITDDSFAFCQQLLEQEFVALTPGADFGAAHGPEKYLRIAYTTDEARLTEALDRLSRFITRNKK